MRQRSAYLARGKVQEPDSNDAVTSYDTTCRRSRAGNELHTTNVTVTQLTSMTDCISTAQLHRFSSDTVSVKK